MASRKHGIGRKLLTCALLSKLAGVIVVPPNELVDELKGRDEAER